MKDRKQFQNPPNKFRMIPMSLPGHWPLDGPYTVEAAESLGFGDVLAHVGRDDYLITVFAQGVLYKGTFAAYEAIKPLHHMPKRQAHCAFWNTAT